MIHHFLKIIKNELKIKKNVDHKYLPPPFWKCLFHKKAAPTIPEAPLHWTGVFGSRLVAKTKTAV